MADGYGAVRHLPVKKVVTPWLTARQAAAYCCYGSAERIYKAVRAGELSPSADTGKMLFHVDDLDEWLYSTVEGE